MATTRSERNGRKPQEKVGVDGDNGVDLPRKDAEDFTHPAHEIERNLDLLIKAVSDYQCAKRYCEARDAQCSGQWDQDEEDMYGTAYMRPMHLERDRTAAILRTCLTWFRTAATDTFCPAVRTLICELARRQRPIREGLYECDLEPDDDRNERAFGALIGEWWQLSELLAAHGDSIPPDETLRAIIARGAMTLSLLRAMFWQIGFPVQHWNEWSGVRGHSLPSFFEPEWWKAWKAKEKEKAAQVHERIKPQP